MRLPRTIPRLVLEILCLLCLLLQFLLPLLLWSRLPDPMPTHFNAAGEADGWGSRWTVFISPGISLLMWLSLGIVNWITPRHWNLPFTVPPGREIPVYGTVLTMLVVLKLETLLVFGGVEWMTVTRSARYVSLAVWLPCAAVFATLGIGLCLAWRRRFR